MKYYLLTGATGLLGRYLVRDLLAADLPLVVLVRPTRFETAQQRMEMVMAHWEAESGSNLPRPVVFEGDISQPSAGLTADQRRWIAANCRGVIHSAASLEFVAASPESEPWISNVQGTRNVLDLCRATGQREFHYVSTAYVCGCRRGQILECERNLGQELVNDYERSKLTSEQSVADAGCFDSLTFYRPSIIVGDSQSGYTSTFHGFYTPLRLVHGLVSSVSVERLLEADYLSALNLEGDERKNLVPVDWVSAVMAHLIVRPEHHGKTYHLTNPSMVTASVMRETFAETLFTMMENRTRPQLDPTLNVADSFREQMGVYQSYWHDDPEFDCTNTLAAASHLPCPVVDPELIAKLTRFAVEANFGWPREFAPKAKYQVDRHLQPWLEASKNVLPGEQSKTVGLQVNGSGGGQWHLVVENGNLVGAGVGVPASCPLTCYTTSATLARLAEGGISVEQAIGSGRLIMIGNTLKTNDVVGLLRKLLSTAPPR